MKVTILGSRGSIPTNGISMTEFGGSTSCVMVEAGETLIFLDAGTGITSVRETDVRSVSVLLTHPHIDHLLGLPFFPYARNSGHSIDIYAETKEGLDTRAQIDSFISPPLWPCTIDSYPSKITCREFVSPCDIGGVKVTSMQSCHPGGSTIFRLEHDGVSFVYATDYENTPQKDEELIELCRDTDLLLYDGQYTAEEFAQKGGSGHSTPEHGVYIMEQSNAKMMRILHHDPHHSDEDLIRMENAVKTDKISFARQGETICLQR